MHLFGVGDHGGGPTRAMLDSGDTLDRAASGFSQRRFSASRRDSSRMSKTKLDTEHSPVWNYKSIATADTNLPPRRRWQDQSADLE